MKCLTCPEWDEAMHVWKRLEVFNVIRRFFNWDLSSTHFSNNKFRLKPVHSFQTCHALTKPWEVVLFPKSDLLFRLCKTVQASTFSSQMLCSVLCSDLVISGLQSPQKSQNWKWPWYELGFASGGYLEPKFCSAVGATWSNSGRVISSLNEKAHCSVGLFTLLLMAAHTAGYFRKPERF